MSDSQSPRIRVGGLRIPANSNAPPVRDHLILTPHEEWISDPADTVGTTRKILRYEVAPNPHDEHAKVRASIVHQRRTQSVAKNGESWVNCESVSLSKLYADHLVRMNLSGRETMRLFVALYRLYKEVGTIDGILDELGHIAIAAQSGPTLITHQRQLLATWISQEGTDFFELVEQLRPDLFEALLMRRAREDKRLALETFQVEMRRSLDHEEGPGPSRIGNGSLPITRGSSDSGSHIGS